MVDRSDIAEFDESELLAAVRKIIAQARRPPSDGRSGHSLRDAYSDAYRNDPRCGKLAGLIVLWVTSGRGDAEALEIANDILNGAVEDPRREEVNRVVRGLASGEITWERLVKMSKTGLLPPLEGTPASGMPVGAARETLELMLGDADRLEGNIDASRVWRVFKAFAASEIMPAPPIRIEHDSCLFQWGVHDWGDGAYFELDFTRQLELFDVAINQKHLEHISITLLFDPSDSSLSGLGAGEIWSGEGLRDWFDEVEALASFTIPIAGYAPVTLRVVQQEVD
jgi:hypothetical protein